MGNYVELLGYYGGDLTHAMSAWTSTSRDLTEEKKTRIPGLLKYLAENGHHTPFEKSFLHFLVRCDTASHIHILKHRAGVSVNAESARYRELNETFYIPEDWPPKLQTKLRKFNEKAAKNYHQTVGELEVRFGRKRAKEAARFFLPYANQLNLDVSFNFRSFMWFQGLRNKEDAQLEICMIAQEMLDLIRDTGAFEHSLKGFGYGSS